MLGGGIINIPPLFLQEETMLNLSIVIILTTYIR